jgi:hypothetical protein
MGLCRHNAFPTVCSKFSVVSPASSGLSSSRLWGANALYSSGGHFVRRPLDLGSVKYGNDDGDGIGECGSFPRIISCGCNDWTSRIDVACV